MQLPLPSDVLCSYVSVRFSVPLPPHGLPLQLPFYALIVFGCYALVSVGSALYNYRDCDEAYDSLQDVSAVAARLGVAGSRFEPCGPCKSARGSFAPCRPASSSHSHRCLAAPSLSFLSAAGHQGGSPSSSSQGFQEPRCLKQPPLRRSMER